MNIDRVQALLAASALCTTPFLFGAQGKGCQPLSFPDAGVDASSSAPDSDSSVCIDRVLCIRGDHFDPVACKCVPDEDASSQPDAGGRRCIDNVLCIQGDHWDPVACKCVPGCMSAADCHGALPQVCVAECDGGPGACAHFACRAGACETVICE